MNDRALFTPRRGLLTAAAAGAVLAAGACAKGDSGKGEEIPAVEDLMREHGVLRRVLVIYREAAAFVRANFSSVDGKLIWRAADIFRRFGEAYHEQQLEEALVFPQVMKAGGEAALLVTNLIAQHVRGRQVTAFIQAKTAAGAVSGTDALPLAMALESFARMYEAHSAYEDTIVFLAWRKSLSKQALADVAGKFKDIETATFKGDGFGPALAEAAAIETAMRIHDLSHYTAPAPGEAEAGLLAPANSVEGGD